MQASGSRGVQLSYIAKEAVDLVLDDVVADHDRVDVDARQLLLDQLLDVAHAEREATRVAHACVGEPPPSNSL